MEASNARAPQLYLEYRFYQLLGPHGNFFFYWNRLCFSHRDPNEALSLYQQGYICFFFLIPPSGSASSLLFWHVWEIQCPRNGASRAFIGRSFWHVWPKVFHEDCLDGRYSADHAAGVCALEAHHFSRHQAGKLSGGPQISNGRLHCAYHWYLLPLLNSHENFPSTFFPLLTFFLSRLNI